MNLAGHIVWKDLRALRWPLAAFWAIVAAKLALGFALILVMRPEWPGSTLSALAVGFAAVERVLTFVLTGMLVQEDALVGSTQFWVTRPISSARLLGAKLAGWLVLLWLVPVALTLPWWLTCSFGAREMARAALELLAVQAVAALPAAVVAALTDTLSRFLIWAFVGLFAVVTVPGSFTYFVARSTVSASSGVLVVTGWTVIGLVGAAVIVRQYLRREWVGSLVWLGVGLAAVPVAGLVVALALTRLPEKTLEAWLDRGRWTDWHPERGKDVSLQFHSYRAEQPTGRTGNNERWVSVDFSAQGVPPEDWLVPGYAARLTWRWPGGPTVERNSLWMSQWGGAESQRLALGLKAAPRDEETERFHEREREEREKRQLQTHRRSVRARAELLRAAPVGLEATSAVMPSTVERMRRTPPAFEATVQLRQIRPEPWIEVPFKPGGWHARGGHGFRLDGIRPRTDGGKRDAGEGKPAADEQVAALSIVATAPDFLWNEISPEARWWRYRWLGPVFCVVNRPGGDLQGQYVSSATKVSIASVSIMRDHVRAWQPTVRRGDRWVPREERWLEKGTFVLMGFREEARFTREVKVERFAPEVGGGAP